MAQNNQKAQSTGATDTVSGYFENNLISQVGELIPISENNGKRAVSARELHGFLESKQDFSTWIKSRIDKYDLVENVDYEVFHNFVEKSMRGRPTIEYALTIEAAKELSMVEGNEKGKMARKYFIECERRLKESKPGTGPSGFSLPDFTNPAEAARAWAEQYELKLIAQADAAESKRQVDILIHTNKTYTATEIAKEAGLQSANQLNKLLNELKVQYKVNKTWVPYQKYATLGWFDIKQEVADNGHIIYHRRITGEGRKGILDLIANGIIR